MVVTHRLAERIYRDFGEEAEGICALLQDVDLHGLEEDEVERILSAAVMISNGNIDEFLEAHRLMERDWRDLLCEAGLERDDWPVRLECFFNVDDSSP